MRVYISRGSAPGFNSKTFKIRLHLPGYVCGTKYLPMWRFQFGPKYSIPAIWTAYESEMAHRHTNTIPTTYITIIGTELVNIEDVLTLKNLSGKGEYTRLLRALIVSSCTAALEMAAILADTFALRDAVPVVVDLEDATMNIGPNLIEEAITPKTRAIIPVHYGGVAKRHKLFVCEDAAMACMSIYKGQMLGMIGNVGCLSFQEKKSFTAGGQGRPLLINDPALAERAEILYNHGTNRPRFMRREVDRYQWLDPGLNATLSEPQAAFLYTRHIWDRYFVSLLPLVRKGYITLPHVPNNTTYNANVFYIRVIDPTQCQDMIQHMASANVQVHPQYMPLQSSLFAGSHSRFHGDDRVTSLTSSQILLLPVHLALSDEAQEVVIREVFAFWGETAEGGIEYCTQVR
ncbi:pyridoxal phosphate-dependent transferase [Aspergillus tamarii]|uniref:Pyridoxal phosphate-dependent transferase n=1 Tax=Aspergillus tamarii TaxID=41984 RepID=A0A5N6UHJ8_ASPTM|nr:pyridoxal phosphate-dependent transferase [Aspergillus tamarii]